MVSQEVGPLRALRDAGGLSQCAPKRLRISRGECGEQVLVHPEVEHHVQPVAAGEILLRLFGHDVRLAEQRGVSRPPLQELADVVEPIELQPRLAAVDRGLLQHERHGVDPEPGDTQLEPVADDPPYLLAHHRVRHVEIGLEVVEAVEVPLPDALLVAPGLLLHAGEHHADVPVGRTLVRPHVPVDAGPRLGWSGRP